MFWTKRKKKGIGIDALKRVAMDYFSLGGFAEPKYIYIYIFFRYLYGALLYSECSIVMNFQAETKDALQLKGQYRYMQVYECKEELLII